MDTCRGKYFWYKGYTNIPKWREKIMVNRLYNKQVSPKGYMKGGRVKKMGGGMMKRGVYKKGSFPDMSGDGKVTQKDILIAKGVIKKPGNKKKKVVKKMKNKKKVIG